MTADYDIAFVGGGLAATLAALRLADKRPGIRLALIEAGSTIGGEHTWSFHDTDLDAADHAWTAPLIDYRWPRQNVRFPGFARDLPIGYRTITASTLHRVASERLGPALLLGAPARDVGPCAVTLEDGRRITAGAVVEARGRLPEGTLLLGWQKFVGHELRTVRPHGVAAPVIMDATVEQRDGYRFVYLLPFAPDRLLVEDTYYSDAPALDDAGLDAAIGAYVEAAGWQVAETVRSERGVLPIALGGDIDALWRAAPPGIARIGLAAGLFHPTTGYSLPDAVRLAGLIAEAPRLDGASLRALTEGHSRATWRSRGMYRFLNRMLFTATAPGERWRLLARFYGLPEGLIARFYADRLKFADRVRLLTGRPPVPIARAFACIPSPAHPAA